MRSRFPAGRLQVCPDSLSAIDRSAMVAALVEHFTAEPREGTIRTDHAHRGYRFQIVTDAGRRCTAIRLIRGAAGLRDGGQEDIIHQPGPCDPR